MFKNLLKAKRLNIFNSKALNATKNKFYLSSKITTDSFLNGTSATYVEEMYRAWLQDNKSVHISWDAYFRALEKGVDPSDAFQLPPTIDKGINT